MSEAVTNESLGAEDAEFFHREGYLVLPGFIANDFNERLIVEVDELMRHREAGDNRLLVSYREMGLLTSHPPLMDKLDVLMGDKYSMHHIHSTRHDPGNGGVHWHQDYVQFPQTNRSHLMVHVFYYLNGLNGEIGDLLVLPHSQNMVICNGGLIGCDAFCGFSEGIRAASWHAKYCSASAKKILKTQMPPNSRN